MDVIKQWNTLIKINYRIYLVFIMFMSQIYPYILWKKLFDFKWFIKIFI